MIRWKPENKWVPLHSHRPNDTFTQLAQRYCHDETIHYTSSGGFKGGKEVAELIAQLEETHGHGPEVLLSVDTMAILPGDLLEKYQCFSTHPGPLDTRKIEGMQGTLRSLVNHIFYDREGNSLSPHHPLGLGQAYVKGTLFMQHPELDKGPPLETTFTPVVPGMCDYQIRHEVYHSLTDAMIDHLPDLLDTEKRAALVERITQEKAALDEEPTARIGRLEKDELSKWQQQAIGFGDGEGNVTILQNQIINPDYFKSLMRKFFPGSDTLFESAYEENFGEHVTQLQEQQQSHLTDSWARYHRDKPGVTITLYEPGTTKIAATYQNEYLTH